MRVYVARRLIGWYDRTAGRIEVKDRARERLLREILTPFLGGTVTPSAAVADVPKADRLSKNKPGAALDKHISELVPSRTKRVLSRVLGVQTEATTWEAGRSGEQQVGRKLDRLSRHGWKLINSVPLPKGSDIDHLLVGPAGVFCVNTKNHGRSNIVVLTQVVRVGGGNKQYIRNSRNEARRVSRILTTACRCVVEATPTLIFVGTGRLDTRLAPPDVLAIHVDQIEDTFRAMPTRLDRQTIDTVFAVADNQALWLAG